MARRQYRVHNVLDNLNDDTDSGSDYEITESDDEFGEFGEQEDGVEDQNHVHAPTRTEWSVTDDFNVIDEPVVDPEMYGKVNVDTQNFNAIDYFQLFFPENTYRLIATETNRYAEEIVTNTALSPNSRFKKWKPTTPQEIKAFIALQLSMGLCSKSNVEEYWGTWWLTNISFSQVMSRDRFQILQSTIHFANNANRIPRGEDGYDPLFKIRPLIDLTENTYAAAYLPKKELSIDESMIKFKGRIFFRQYMPMKPHKWGIKYFGLCEAESGYVLKGTFYTGKSSFLRDREVPLTEQVVLSLVGERRNYNIFMDNFFSSPTIFWKLLNNDNGATGTVRPGRQGLPREITNSKLSKRDPGPIYMKSDDNKMIVCSWYDTKRVNFLSTVYGTGEVAKVIRSKNAPEGERNVQKPVVADNYNKYMGGVDRFDQLSSYYSYPHKSQKWYHTLYHFILQVACVNGFILFKKQNAASTLTSMKFRQQLIDELLAGFELHVISPGRRRILHELPFRQVGRHFLERYDNPKYRPDCKICSNRDLKHRRQTSYQCDTCKIPICFECFKPYHTR